MELAVQEEIARNTKPAESVSEEFGKIPKAAETERQNTSSASASNTESGKALERELMDLKITNRGKDYFIEQLQKERESFAQERQGYVEKLMSFNRRVGELETKLLQLAAPRSNSDDHQTGIKNPIAISEPPQAHGSDL